MSRKLRAFAGSALAVAMLLGCAEPEPPPRAWLVGRKEAAASLLDRLATVEGTPLAREARRLRAALPDCTLVASEVEAFDLRALVEGLRCGDVEASHPRLASHDLAFAWPLVDGGVLRGALTLRGDDVDLEMTLPTRLADTTLGLVLPGDEAPGPGVLALDGTLAHARLRPAAGLDLARFVRGDGQASQLFRLKSALFAGTVLDGTWEAAVYTPRGTDGVPPVALAVGFHARGPAVRAIEQFISDLRGTWDIERRDFALGEASGACLPDLRILPELSPCYVATDRALVVGWNPRSLSRALDAGASRSDAPGGVHLALSRFRAADAHLAALAGSESKAGAPALPWSALRATGRRDAGGFAIELRLAGDGVAPLALARRGESRR